jgi:hypothetical protein
MRLYIYLLPLFIVFGVIKPSTSPPLLSHMANTVDAGKLLGQLVSALKPSSFTDAFKKEKTNWLDKAKGAADPASLASSVTSLTSFIKPGLFKTGALPGILSAAGAVKSMPQVGNLLKSLEGGLKPEAFASTWPAQKTGWLSALSMLK